MSGSRREPTLLNSLARKCPMPNQLLNFKNIEESNFRCN